VHVLIVVMPSADADDRLEPESIGSGASAAAAPDLG
jgi:hypothetical protein